MFDITFVQIILGYIVPLVSKGLVKLKLYFKELVKSLIIADKIASSIFDYTCIRIFAETKIIIYMYRSV